MLIIRLVNGSLVLIILICEIYLPSGHFLRILYFCELCIIWIQNACVYQAQVLGLPRWLFCFRIISEYICMSKFSRYARNVLNWYEMKENRRKRGNGKKLMNWRGRKCLSVSNSHSPFHRSLSISHLPLCPLHFLILSPFPCSPSARLQQVVTPWRALY